MNFQSSEPMLAKSGEVTVMGAAPGFAGASAIARGVIGVVRAGRCAAASSAHAMARKRIKLAHGLSI
jgi:hypothetical protein